MNLPRITRTACFDVTVICLGLAMATGCGGGGSGGGAATISSNTLSGKLGGQPWTLMTGQTNSSLSTSARYWVDAYADQFTACTGAAPFNSDELILNLPTAVGSYSLSLNLNETFYVSATSQNLVATSGSLVISAISGTTISGGANFAYDADNSVDGQFELTICP